MTIREAATHAGVCEAVVRSWVKSGTLPHYRLGTAGKRGKIVIRLEDLEAFLAGKRVEIAVTVPAPKVTKPKHNFKHLRVN